MNAAPWAAYACLALSMLLVGSYVGLSKLLLNVFPVFLLAGLRFGIAALAMVHWVPRSASERALSPHDRWLLFLESFLGNFLFSICMLYGVLWSSAVSAGVVMAAIPAAVALLSRVFLHERISARVTAAIACAALGIALLAVARPADAVNDAHPPWRAALGHLLLLGAVFCEASYVVIGKRLAAQVSPRRISALINLWGLLLVMPFALWQGIVLRLRGCFAAELGLAAVLFARRQRGHRLAVDARLAPRAGLESGRVHGAAAGRSRVGRSDRAA